MRKPAGIFDEGDDLDISGFEKLAEASKPVPEIRAAAEAANFQSREPKSPAPRKANRYRTGRNIPLATKISKRANELLYGIYDEHKDLDGNPTVTIGEILERGLELYRRELGTRKSAE